MTSVSKNVYIDKLDDIVNKYNNTYHNTIIMKSADVKSDIYINSSKKTNDKGTKLKTGDVAKTFAKRYDPNWSEKDFMIKKIKNTVPWTYVIGHPKGEEIVGTFYKK